MTLSSFCHFSESLIVLEWYYLLGFFLGVTSRDIKEEMSMDFCNEIVMKYNFILD